jgi:hypothetical protein
MVWGEEICEAKAQRPRPVQGWITVFSAIDGVDEDGLQD